MQLDKKQFVTIYAVVYMMLKGGSLIFREVTAESDSPLRATYY